MNIRHAVMAIAFIAAAGLMLFGDKSPPQQEDTPASEEVVRAEPRVTFQPPSVDAIKGLAARPLPGRLPDADEGADAEANRLFAMHSWAPPPPKPLPAPPVVPTAPPIPFVVIGKKIEAGHWEVYLDAGGETQIASVNTVINGTYRVKHIKPPLLTLTYLPLGQDQELNIGTME